MTRRRGCGTPPPAARSGRPMEHPDGVSAVAFSPDGKTILTGCYDSTARLWDADRQATRPGHRGIRGR